MDKTVYNKMKIQEQLTYVNFNLKQGQTLRAIADIIGISKSTVRERFGKIGYLYNSDLKQYTEDLTFKELVVDKVVKVSKIKPTEQIKPHKRASNIINDIEVNKLLNIPKSSQDISQVKSQLYIIPKKVTKIAKKSFNVFMDKDLVSAIDRIAKLKNYSRNELISIMCRMVINNNKDV